MISKTELQKIKNELVECQNPFFFFHDDADGLCSFLQMYQFKGEGKGHVVKTRPYIDENFAALVPEECDKVFILDIAVVTQDFADKIKKPVVWIDHHTPQEISGVKYFNPRVKHPDEYTAISAICYEALGENILLGALGTIGDISPQPFLSKFLKEYSAITEKKKDLWDLIFSTKTGELIKILEFNLKGPSKEIRKSIGIFMRTKDFASLLNPKTKDEKYVYEKYRKVREEYDKIMRNSIKVKGDPFVFVYKEENYVLGGDVAREIPYRIPGKKIYIICREKSGRMLCSLRTGKKVDLVKFLKHALTQVEGFGGGHPFAAGCNVKKEDFERFIELARDA